MPAPKKLSLDATLKLLTPFLATDKKIDDVKAALLGAADAMPSEQSSKAVEDKRAKDRAARDAVRAADRKARDEAQKKEDEAKDAKIAADRAARDAKFGEDRDNDPEGTNDAEVMKACDKDMEAEDAAEKEVEDSEMPANADPSTAAHGGKSEKPAMDKATVEATVAAAVQAEREAGKALRVALDKVGPVLGKVTFDSAPEAYRAALTKLTVDHKGVADSALPALFDAATRTPVAAAPLAHDAAANETLAKLIPNINRLS